MKALTLAGVALLLAASPAQAAMRMTLDDAIDRALKTHPDSLSADAQLQSAKLGVDDAQSQRLALTAAVSSLGRHASSGLLDTTGAVPTALDTATANSIVSATVPIFTGFKITNSINAATSRRDEAQASRSAERQTLAFDVTKSYWNLYRAEALQEAQDAVNKDAQQTLDLTKTSLKVGRATAMDVTRATVSLLNARGDMLASEQSTREARTDLAKLVGMAPDAVEIVPPTPVDVAPVAEAKQKPPHPKLVAAQAHADAANSDVATATGDRWPQLSLVSSYQYGNNPYDPTLGSYALGTSFGGTWDVRLALSYNLFDLGKVERGVQRSKADAIVAEAGLEKARRDVASDLSLAGVHVENAYQRLSLATQSSQLAQQALTWTQTRYKQGYALQVEVIDARHSYLTSLTQRVQALCDYQIARAELAQAEGRPIGKETP